MTSKPPELYGLILMGGESSRMGSDKSLLMLNGKPQFQHLYDLLSSICDKVFLSCNSKQANQIPNEYIKIVDNDKLKGPITGIKGAFEYKKTNWLVVPVDMPFLSKEVLNNLKSEINRDVDVVCTQSADGHINPLLAIYKKTCSDHLINYPGDSPKKFINDLPYYSLIISDKENININTKEELHALKRDQG